MSRMDALVLPPSGLEARQAHLARLVEAIASLAPDLPRLDRWSAELAARARDGGRLLVAGNGGSAAQAEHLAAELVGRYQQERPPMSAVALSADGATTTALANDYGVTDLFTRQVVAHGRPGDVLLALSTSGRSANVVRAARVGRERGLAVWALTGIGPNPLVRAADEAVAVASEDTATIQEVHQLAIHLLCEGMDERLRGRDR